MPSAADQPWVLGISASHNGAVCLLHGDEIVVAIQEERLSRLKRHRIYGSGQSLAISYCLNYAGLDPAELDLVVLCVQGRLQDANHDICRDPFLNLRAHGTRTLTIPHHYGHAFSAFATSGFADSAILIVDGAGSPASDFISAEKALLNGHGEDPWETISVYYGCETMIVPLEKHVVDRGAWLVPYAGEMPSFGSLGGMFSAAAEQIFGESTEAGKVMGLASYAEASFPSDAFFDIDCGRFCFKDTVPLPFRHARRWPEQVREYEGLAASVQEALEVALLHLVRRLRELCRSDNLCYAGGVALNSIANERLIRESGYKNVYIMPAAEDSGPAVGAAYYGLWQLTKHNSRRRLRHDALGRTYTTPEISTAIAEVRSLHTVHSTNVISDAVDLLCDGKIIGWFDGGAELGPRALGQRSILCDPRRPDAKAILNRRVKMREPFRPFAPAVLLDEAQNWFEFDGTSSESQFMLRVCEVKRERRDDVPAVVHVDGTGRLQTLTRETNGRFYELVKSFHERTGVPILLNTSFNRMGEPIVETPRDALNCLVKSGLDGCVFADRIVLKTEG